MKLFLLFFDAPHTEVLYIAYRVFLLHRLSFTVSPSTAVLSRGKPAFAVISRDGCDDQDRGKKKRAVYGKILILLMNVREVRESLYNQ
jgi:hypothetical protein